MYLDPKLGGIGLIEISDFLIAQQCTWVKKAHDKTIDSWRYDVKILSHGNCLAISPSSFLQEDHPILRQIAYSFNIFKTKFTLVNDNFKNAFIFNNPCFKRGIRDNGILDENFFRQNPRVDLEKISGLTFNNIFEGNNPRQLETINLTCNTNLNLVTYLRLIGSLSFFIRSKKSNHSDNTSVSLSTFLSSFTKGSKKIRYILCKNKNKSVKIENSQSVVTFFRLTTLIKPENNILSRCLSLWSVHSFPNRVRDFFFKFINNSLGINTRVAHFVQNFDRNCTFCSLGNPDTNNEETFVHLFFDCEHVNSWLIRFRDEFFPETGRHGDNNIKAMFFTCCSGGATNYFFFLHSALWTFLYIIWEYKLRKKLPSYRGLKIEFFATFFDIYKRTPDLMYTRQKSNFLLCTNWIQIKEDYNYIF